VIPSSPEFETMMAGSSTDYTEIENDGTLVAKGDATCWDDIVGSLIARRLESTVGRLQYNYDENTITMQDGGSITANADRLMFNFQYPHAATVDGMMNVHIHWEQTSTDQIEWTLQYRIQSNFADKDETWTTCTSNSVDDSVGVYSGSGTFNQITRLCDIDMTGATISATVQFRLARTDSTGSDIEATFVDAHVLLNMFGSRKEFVK